MNRSREADTAAAERKGAEPRVAGAWSTPEHTREEPAEGRHHDALRCRKQRDG